MHAARSLFATFALGISVTSAPAQGVIRPDIATLVDRVALGCAIEAEKVFAVTNTTANPIVAGTPIFIDILHFPNGAHDELHYHGATLPVGATFREGTFQATSCTAWIEVPRMMAPSALVPGSGAGPLPGPAAPFGSLPTRR